MSQRSFLGLAWVHLGGSIYKHTTGFHLPRLSTVTALLGEMLTIKKKEASSIAGITEGLPGTSVVSGQFSKKIQ